MANHVTSGIEIVEGNDAVTEWFAGLCERITIPADEREGYEAFRPVYELFDEWPESENEMDTYSWFHENIGPKWCHVFDADDTRLMFESAWGYPDALFLRIHQEAHKIDPNVIMSAHYDDEMPNFFGSCVYADGELYDEEYWDEDTYHVHDLKFWWDEEEDGEEPDDFDSSEAYEKMWEIIQDDIDSNEEEDGEEPDDFDSSEAYEKMWEIIQEDIDSMVQGLKDYREELAEENDSE